MSDVAISAIGEAGIEQLRSQMVRFASLQLSDRTQAEDAVQEALMGALRNGRSFQGRSALRTWVFSILKFKIADILRQNVRHGIVVSYDDADDPIEDALFRHSGRWQEAATPAEWSDPGQSLESEQFWRVFEQCLTRLPEAQARVFLMREFLELDWQEICAATGVTHANLNVLLYRARLRLRACLEAHWFAEEGRPC